MSAAFVTIVSGLPRSGTSLLMQMLGAGGLPLLADEIRVADESNPAGYMEYEPVKQIGRDVSWFAGAAGRAVKIRLPLSDSETRSKGWIFACGTPGTPRVNAVPPETMIWNGF